MVGQPMTKPNSLLGVASHGPAAAQQERESLLALKASSSRMDRFDFEQLNELLPKRALCHIANRSPKSSYLGCVELCFQGIRFLCLWLFRANPCAGLKPHRN